MPSRREAMGRCLLAATACLLLIAGGVQAQDARNGKAPTTVEVRSAIETLKADPNLVLERKTRTLKWKEMGAGRRAPSPGLLQWLAEMFKWLGSSARLLVWAVIAVLAALLAVAVMRQLRQVDLRPAKRRSDAPTHVRDLDIRPESLPDDIGAAALSLWEGGEQRAALSLLYRGLLSRLVHAYRVPIKQSSTEGDCLLLAEHHVEQATAAYASRLVRTWQRAVYGGKEAEPAEVRLLCADFGAALATGLDTERPS